MLDGSSERTKRWNSNNSGTTLQDGSAAVATNNVTQIPNSSNQPKRFSRDEMNLAEFPLAVLSTRHDSSVKTLEFSDTLTGKNGERIERKWVITGADKFGLPTASDDEVLLGLLRLSASQEFRSRKVEFTRYELLRILKWSTEGRSYTRLQRALDRLSGVRIKTSNGFYDNSSKSHQTRNFGVIDAYELNDSRSLTSNAASLQDGGVPDDSLQSDDASDRDRPEENREASAQDLAEGKELATIKPSFFMWSEQMFKSFQSGFIKKLDLDFLLDLSSAISKRLYRFLDKHFWYRAKITYNLFTFAHEKIGVSRNYAYASQLKQQLQPAIDELISKGFLSGCEYSGKGKDTQITLVAGNGPTSQNAAREKSAVAALEQKAATAQSGLSAPGSLARVIPITSKGTRSSQYAEPSLNQHTEQAGNPDGMIAALKERGLAHPQALKLATKLDGKSLERAWAVLQHFDELMQSNSGRISRNPAGFLYRAIERLDDFVLPGEQRDTGNTHTGSARRTTRSTAQPDGSSASSNRTPYAATSGTAANKAQRTVSQQALAQKMHSRVTAESARTQAERVERSALKDSVEPELLAKIRKEVTEGLEKVRGLISPSRFSDTVEHAVEERLARLLGY